MQLVSISTGLKGFKHDRFLKVGAIAVALVALSSLVVTAQIPTGRWGHSTVWTGTEMIVWGGFNSTGVTEQTGARYNPNTDSWVPISTNGAPSARVNHAAVWTGTTMIIWGGEIDLSSGVAYDDGSAYDPQTDTWTPLPSSGAPFRRYSHSYAWTGSNLWVWGGQFSPSVGTNTWLNTGGTFVPGQPNWGSTTTLNAPLGRTAHSTVWTGSKMIVWGGVGFISPPTTDTGSIYDPSLDQWVSLPLTSGLTPRSSHTAVWTGTEMLVWGGHDTSTSGIASNGARLAPDTLTWNSISQTNAPAGRYSHSAVWTGNEMIVWGGNAAAGSLNTGGRYSPASGTWTNTPVIPSLKQRQFHTAVWTGTEMIVYGGYDAKGKIVPTIARYNPTQNAWINSPPKCNLVTPTNNQTINLPASLTLSATASDNNGSVTNVQFFYDTNILIGSSTGPVYSVTWTNVPPGQHIVFAKATDDLGALTISTSNTIFAVAPSPPVVVIDVPTNNFSVLGPTNIQLSAIATTTVGVINSVQFFLGLSLLGATNVPPFTLDSGGLSPGNYNFRAVASNSFGLLATSAPVTVYILTKPKVLSPQLFGDTVQYSVQGIAGQTYIVDAATNLSKPSTTWVPIATNIAPSDLFFFSDPDGTNYGRRFYRWRQ